MIEIHVDRRLWDYYLWIDARYWGGHDYGQPLTLELAD